MTEDYENLGKVLVQKFRDENFESYLRLKDFASSMTLDEYQNLPKNPNFDPLLQLLEDNRFQFLNGLDESQKKQLDLLILKILDGVAFGFLREVEEDLYRKQSIGLTFKGESVEKIHKKFLSGSFFGEYFLWLEKHSKYGKFQH